MDVGDNENWFFKSTKNPIVGELKSEKLFFVGEIPENIFRFFFKCFIIHHHILMDDYPEYLKFTPKIVIGLVNYHEYHDKVKTKFKNSLSTKRLKILSFQSVDDLHSPKNKVKREYNGYTPKGILKRGWVLKHQNLVAGVLIVLVTLDLSNKNNLKKEEKKILQEVEKVQFKVDGFKPPKVVVLILCSESLSVSHFFDEFIKNLKSTCRLENKMIYFCELKNLDSPLSLPKFEKTIHDLSISYYKETLLKVRKLKNDVKKEIQPYLYCRHRFKVGIFHEILGNNVKCLKYYHQSYNVFKLIKKEYSDKELHFCSDWINFKCCYLRIKEELKNPTTGKVGHKLVRINESINQFLDQMKRSRGKNKFVLEHEYYRNMYKQYRMFGECLEMVLGGKNFGGVKQKSSNITPYQCPGFYYQLAAFYAKLRRKSCLMFKKQYSNKIKEFYPTEEKQKQFGKHDETVVKTGFVGKDILYINEDEKTMINQLSKNKFIRSIAVEFFFEHEKCVVEMLKKAVDYYKGGSGGGVQENKKILLGLFSQIGGEYFLLENFEECEKNFMKIKKEYFRLKWYDILSPILFKLLECSKVRENQEEYVKNSLLLLSNSFTIQQETKLQKNFSVKQEKKKILNEFENFFSVPSNNQDFRIKKPMSLDINKHLLLEIKINFNEPFSVVYKKNILKIEIKLNCCISLMFDELEIIFSDKKYNITKKGVKLNPKFNYFEFECCFTEKKDILVKVLKLIKKSKEGVKLELIWVNLINSSILDNYDHRLEVGSQFVHRPVIRIKEPESKTTLSFSHSPPMLLNERYAVLVKINPNTEHILKGKLFIHIEKFKDISVYNDKFEKTVIIPFGEIKPKTVKKILVYVQAKIPELKRFKFTLEYSSSLYHKMEYSKSIQVWVFCPLLGRFSIIGTRCESDTKTIKIITNNVEEFYQKIMNKTVVNERISKNEFLFNSNSPFMLQTNLICDTPFPLKINSCELIINESCAKYLKCISPNKIVYEKNFPVVGDKSFKSSKDSLEKLDFVTVLNILQCDYVDIPLKILRIGKMKISCERKLKAVKQQEIKEFSFKIPLPSISIINSPISLYVDYDNGTVKGEEMKFRLTIQNNSELLEEVQIKLKDSTHFLVSGPTDIIFELIPLQIKVVDYIFIPLGTGVLQLPQFYVKSINSNVIVVDYEPWTTFVKNESLESAYNKVEQI